MSGIAITGLAALLCFVLERWLAAKQRCLRLTEENRQLKARLTRRGRRVET